MQVNWKGPIVVRLCVQHPSQITPEALGYRNYGGARGEHRPFTTVAHNNDTRLQGHLVTGKRLLLGLSLPVFPILFVCSVLLPYYFVPCYSPPPRLGLSRRIRKRPQNRGPCAIFVGEAVQVVRVGDFPSLLLMKLYPNVHDWTIQKQSRLLPLLGGELMILPRTEAASGKTF